MISSSMLVSDPSQGKLAQELAERKMCRICLVESEELIDYLNEHQWTVILTTCFSISIVTAESLPKFVCKACCDFLEKCREFKQLCKKTEIMLVSYPMTGKWTETIEVPNWLRPVRKRQLQQEGEDSVSAKQARKISDEVNTALQGDESGIGSIRVRTNEALTLQSPTISSEMRSQFPTDQYTVNSTPESVMQYCQSGQDQHSYLTIPPYSQYRPSPSMPGTDRRTTSYPLLQQQLLQTPALPTSINSLEYLANSLAPHHRLQQLSQYQYNVLQQMATLRPALPLQPPKKSVASKKSRRTAANQPIRPITPPLVPTTAVQCMTCDFVFASHTHLLHHMRKHHGTAAYHCGCGQNFTQMDAFVHHLKQHPNSRSCGLCGENFQTDRKLYAHLDRHTTTGLTEACDFCSLVFIDNSSRLRHVGRKHSDECRQMSSMNPGRQGR